MAWICEALQGLKLLIENAEGGPILKNLKKLLRQLYRWTFLPQLEDFEHFRNYESLIDCLVQVYVCE